MRMVQARATKMGPDGTMHWVDEADADYFSVYIGEPGAFAWIADFGLKRDALLYMRWRADFEGCTTDDRIGETD